MHRIYLAFLCFFRLLFGKPLPAEVLPAPQLPAPQPAPLLPAPEPPAPPPAPAPDPAVGALQLLALLQREGRLVDFLAEPIDGYDDADIGAAVRDIHRGCRKVLDEHLAVAPVLAGAENDPITVEPGFDPRRVRLVGNIKGNPPFAGVLRHHGWRVARASMPAPGDGGDPTVIAPAEVEL